MKRFITSVSLPLLLCSTFGVVVSQSTLCSEKPYCTEALPTDEFPDNTCNCSIITSSVNRTYLVTVPSTYDASSAVPIFFSFHGGTQTAADQLNLSQLSNPEFNDFALAVYPQGIDNFWQNVPGYNDTDDVQFTQDLITTLSTDYSVNSSRIYATGKSDGGGMVNLLACTPSTSSLIAAFAPVSGAYYTPNSTTSSGKSVCVPDTVAFNCTPSRTNLPILAFHGGLDTTIPYDGEAKRHQCLPSIPHWITSWATRDGLGTSNITIPLSEYPGAGMYQSNGTNGAEDSDTVVYIFGEEVYSEQGSGTGGELSLVFDSVIHHDWPSTVSNDDNSKSGSSVASFNATGLIVEFFERHVLG